MFLSPEGHKCGRCKRTTSEGAEFCQRRTHASGVASHCKTCSLECQAEHYQRSKTRRAKVGSTITAGFSPAQLDGNRWVAGWFPGRYCFTHGERPSLVRFLAEHIDYKG